MIMVTTLGTLLIESAVNVDYVWVGAESVSVLEALIDQVELVGSAETPAALTYEVEDIKVMDSVPLFKFILRMSREDFALFAQSEILNFVRYRKFKAQTEGLDRVGQAIAERVRDLEISGQVYS